MTSEEQLKPVLIIIGNSNVGKTSITRYLVSNPKKFKGKTGKIPGTTLLLKKIQDPLMPFDILDLPGFGFMKRSSRRRTEHIRKMIIIHIEKHFKEFFLGIVVVNALRIRDELEKWFYKSEETIPLTFEFINLFKEFNTPVLVVLNKIDKLNLIDRKKIETFFFDSATKFGLKLVKFNEFKGFDSSAFPVLMTSALKKIGIKELKEIVESQFKKITP